MAFTGKFPYMAHQFILLILNRFGVRLDKVGWWFGHLVSWLRVSLSVGGANNIFWFWLRALQQWGSLKMLFTGKFVYITSHFTLLKFNSFGHRVDRQGSCFEHFVS